jgi:hypothetical protein
MTALALAFLKAFFYVTLAAFFWHQIKIGYESKKQRITYIVVLVLWMLLPIIAAFFIK